MARPRHYSFTKLAFSCLILTFFSLLFFSCGAAVEDIAEDDTTPNFDETGDGGGSNNDDNEERIFGVFTRKSILIEIEKSHMRFILIIFYNSTSYSFCALFS
jgi:hypothetical protein